jgi:hypothetical protein
MFFTDSERNYILFTRQIVISGDAICDETFASTLAETWEPFHGALALRPDASFIPDVEVIPQVIDDGLDSNARRSKRTRNPSKLLTFSLLADRK